MINVSNAYRERMQYNTRFIPHAVITLSNGTALTPAQSDFALSGNGLVDGAGSNGLPLGVAVERIAKIELMNYDERYDETSFLGARVRLYHSFALDDSGTNVENIECGMYTVTEPESYGDTVILTAADDMYRADRPFSTNLTFPVTAAVLFNDICTTIGVVPESLNFLNSGFEIAEAPSTDLTFRQVLGYIAMLAAGNVKINRNGRMEIISYDFDYTGAHHELTAFKSLRTGLDDVVITGVKTAIDKEHEAMSGAEGYVLSLENPLWAGHEATAMALIGARMIGGRFRDFTGDHVAYPLAEFMDKAVLTDRRGRNYNTIITDIDFSFGGFTVLKNSAETPARNSSKYNSSIAQTLRRVGELVAIERSQREAAIQNLADELAHSNGLYKTTEQAEGGGTIYYLHDKPTLAESETVLKLNVDALGLSLDGGDTFPYGLDFSGNAILNKIYAIGIDAQYVKVGNKTITQEIADNYYTETETDQRITAGINGFSSVVAQTYTSKADTPAVNLCPPLYNRENESGNPFTVNGLTFTRNADGSITVTGTATAHSYYTISGYSIPTDTSGVSVLFVDPAKKYRLSGCPSGGGTNTTFRLAARCTVEGTTPSASSGTVYNDNGSGVTVPTGYKYVHIFIAVYSGYACPAGGVTFFPMFEVGETTHAFVSPVIGMSSVVSKIDQTANSLRLSVEQVEDSSPVENLIPYPYVELERRTFPFTGNGVTFTVNDDNTVKANGTATENAWFSFAVNYNANYLNGTYILPAGTYTMSGWPSGNSSKGYMRMAFYQDVNSTASGMTPTKHGTAGRVTTNFVYDDGAGVTFTTTAAYYVRIEFVILSGQTVSNLTVKPMLERGYYKHAYVDPAYGAKRLAAEINLSPGTVVIKGDHISLAGKTLNFTSDNIAITSTNFSVTSSGEITCKSGDIGGWAISSSGLSKYTNYTVGTPTNTAYWIALRGEQQLTPQGHVIDLGSCSYDGSTFSNWSSAFYVQRNGYVGAVGGGKIGAWTLQTVTDGGALYNGMESISDTSHNGAYLGTDGIAFGKANVWIKSNGSFKFGAIRSSGDDHENAWVTNALFVSYGIEILADNDNGTAYIDFHNDKTTPSQSTSTNDFTARIIHSSTNTIMFQGRQPNSGSAETATLVAGQWTVTSDRRLKRGIKALDAEKSKQFIAALKPSSYEYRGTPGVNHHGFIYDELDRIKHDPAWAVSEKQKNIMGDGDSYGTVNYTEIIPDIVAVLQQQMAEINTLKKQLAQMAG